MAALHSTPSTYCRPCLRLLIQSRSFTTSPARRKHGPLPTFTPTPSPDLDALLTTFRTNIFLPAHLIHPQRTLLYTKKHHHLLTSDEPATVRLGSEIHQLHPLSHIHDEPNTRSSFARVLDLMTSTRDFKNLPAFLEGLRTAKRSIKGWQVEKMVRRANESGRMGVVHDCLRRVESTGISLSDIRVAREVMRGAILKAEQDSWSQEGVERGVKYAEDIWALMFSPRHSEKMTSHQDPKKRPEIIGILLLMHASKSVLFHQAKDEEGKVSRYAELLLAHWSNMHSDLKHNSPDIKEEDRWNAANHDLLIWAPVVRAIRFSLQILGPESRIGRLLKERLKGELDPLVKGARWALGEHGTEGGVKKRGVQMFEQLAMVGAGMRREKEKEVEKGGRRGGGEV